MAAVKRGHAANRRSCLRWIMPKNLSRSGAASSIGEFYTAIHARMASRGARWNDARPTVAEFREALRRFSIPPTGLALDAGCGGTAAIALACAQHGFGLVHAMDLNQQSLYRARSLSAGFHKVIRFSCGSVLSMAFRDETFDFAACVGVAHHTPQPEQVVAELARVMKSKGKLYISVYCFAGSAFERFVKMLRFVGDKIPPRAMQPLAERSRLVNNFITDHMYVPVLWLFTAEEMRASLLRHKFSIIAEWASNMDPFANCGWLGRRISGDGLMRIWLCEKP